MKRRTISDSLTPSAEVGSSRMSTLAPKWIARAMATDWRSPPESVAIGRVTSSTAMPKCAISAFAAQLRSSQTAETDPIPAAVRAPERSCGRSALRAPPPDPEKPSRCRGQAHPWPSRTSPAARAKDQLARSRETRRSRRGFADRGLARLWREDTLQLIDSRCWGIGLRADKLTINAAAASAFRANPS
jgi:hypothetical protein